MQEVRQFAGSWGQLPRPNEIRVRNDRVNYLFGVWSKEAVPNREGTTFQKNQLRRLQRRSRETDATIWIGKHGSTDQVLKQVVVLLRSRELVKLKVHKSALEDTETSAIAEKVAALTGSTLIDVMGHTFTLYKRRERPQQEKR